ncbi:hypothetical protein BO71DRAFT_395179 [Aspergillus ellipticus CBS 707.79]|uniref:Uncharacterized protein n=1 Tax=Aspergillus ellipticus CBS 707.79 TaxID=1448320 RepID=A0A319F1P2_9EURO|nr:hypothetical protein BO71DRAFT_395179 [Aspergillus ellipticus CBS 707.79]
MKALPSRLLTCSPCSAALHSRHPKNPSRQGLDSTRDHFQPPNLVYPIAISPSPLRQLSLDVGGRRLSSVITPNPLT